MIDLACGRVSKRSKPKVNPSLPTAAPTATNENKSEPLIIRNLEDIKQEE